ncbi:MAG: hypothetical protein ABI181_07260 [Mycobacteriaceae bacterium]
MRVYVPVTVARLESLVADGELRVAGGTAFALTPALREAYASGDDEELAHVAMGEAARASLRLLGAELEAAGADAEPAGVALRRAVLAVDMDEVTLRPDLDDAVVRVGRPVLMADVAAAHVDTADAEDAVRAAVGAVDAADLGDLDAEFLLGEVADHDLAWYAPQELGFLLELL